MQCAHPTQIISLWQPRLGRDFSREGGRQIIENVNSFFAIPAEWSRAEIPAPANEVGETTGTTGTNEVRHDC